MKQTVVGVLRLTRGRSRRLVVDDAAGNSYDVSPRHGLLVFPGDRVRVELGKPKWVRGRRFAERMEATVVDVLKRSDQMLLGRYQTSAKRAWVVPRDAEAIPPLEVEPKPGVPEGAVVAIDLGKNPGMVSGTVAAVWEDSGSARSLIEQYIYESGLPREFSRDTLRETEAFPDLLSSDETGKRRDLRDLEVVVIDPADARDHDDAVSWEPEADGSGRLGVHIADVSHYVRPGSALDSEARARGVSCYLPDRVIPMLPERLSADLCSLLAGRDRPARTVFLEYAPDGKMRGGEMCASVIRPAASLSYEDVWDVIKDGKATGRQAGGLRAMDTLAQGMRKRRFANGSLDFDFPETKVKLDEHGEPCEIFRKRGNRAHQLIEEFMIAANNFVGEKLARAGAGLWRIHEPPSMDDVAELEDFLKGMGVRLRRGTSSRDLKPSDFQAVIDRFRGTPEEYVVQRKVLQSLRLAVYSEANTGHFGLALKDYAHFTSPIRRYADLVVHRLTAPLAAGASEAGAGRALLATGIGTGPAGRYSVRALAAVALEVSDLERRAQKAEWACNKKMVLRYLKKRVGETFGGTVSRLEKFGVFVELDGVGTEGLVRSADLGNDRYWIAKDGLSMRGKRSGRSLRVGERVRVLLVRVDEAAEWVDLVFEA
jgi:ribonuclease R